MKKLTALLVVTLLCFWMFWTPVWADDTETAPESTDVVITDPDYPPPPDGYVGEWPPPDLETTDGGPTQPADGGDETGWQFPDP